MNSLLPVTLLLSTSILQAGGPKNVETLQAYRETARPLLVFAPDERDSRFQRELNELKLHQDSLRERQVVVLVSLETASTDWRKGLEAACWPLFSAAAGADARRRFGVERGEFVIVLIGKDGGEKMTIREPLSMDRLETTIDAMPMRQQEMHHR